jgi:2-polyprenyl-3-methyl-5-hydroxy-6-metoxy-1,4-benzoquinol methylase
MLALELSHVVRHVTAVDLDEPSIRLAEAQDAAHKVEYLTGDFLTHPFEENFDFIASVAAIHHMDARAALVRMRGLLRPGGTLAVVGLARSRTLADLAADAAGGVVHRAYKATRNYWQHSAPVVWPPPMTYPGIRQLAVEVIPGVRYRRHLMWRYSLVWSKPVE